MNDRSIQTKEEELEEAAGLIREAIILTELYLPEETEELEWVADFIDNKVSAIRASHSEKPDERTLYLDEEYA